MEALEDVPSTGAEHLVSWVKAVIYGAAERWTDVIDEVRGAGGWPDKFLAAAAGVAHGVAAANLGLFTEAERRLTESNSSPAGEACAPAIAWYPGDDAAQPGQRGVGGGAAGVAAGHPSGAQSRCGAEGSELPAGRPPRRRRSPSRTDPWDPASVEADNSGREKLLAEAQAELDRQIGLSRVKEQIEAYRAATQMAKIRAARGMKVAQAVQAHDLHRPARHRQDDDRPRGGQHPGRPRRDRRAQARRDVAQGFRRRVRGPVGGEDQHAPSTARSAGCCSSTRPTRWCRSATDAPTRSAPRRWTRCWPGWRTTATGWW